MSTNHFDTIIFELVSSGDAMARSLEAARLIDAGRESELEHVARMGFATVELLWKTLTPKRWNIVEKMTGAGPLGVRELARRLARDVRGVHADITALAKAGLIDRTEDGKYSFPYSRVKVRFDLRAVA
jgi:predicted transcriptional regulator